MSTNEETFLDHRGLTLARILDEAVRSVCDFSSEEYGKIMKRYDFLEDSWVYQKLLVTSMSYLISNDLPLPARVQGLVFLAVSYGMIGGVAIGQNMKLEEFTSTWTMAHSNETIS